MANKYSNGTSNYNYHNTDAAENQSNYAMHNALPNFQQQITNNDLNGANSHNFR